MGFAPFEQHNVLESGIEMPGAGGGFHKALAVDNLELPHESTCTIIVEVAVTKVRFDPIDDKDSDPDSDVALRRVHVLKVLNAALIDPAEVRERLAEQARRIAEAKGELTLPYSDEEDQGETETEPETV